MCCNEVGQHIEFKIVHGFCEVFIAADKRAVFCSFREITWSHGDDVNQFWDGEQCDRIGSILDGGEAVARRVRNAMTCVSNQNRLIEAQAAGTSVTLVRYAYDAQSRRIAETVGSATTIYVYDGWNPIAEYNTTYALTKTYIWGMDLSGSMQGAGGVGGLLSVTDGTGTYFPTFDGNGNVSEYLDSTGNIVAHYEYDPFGKTTVATGSKANDFSHRFSTKPLNLTTGLYYYGYRFYDPETGRWPSRDPIEEEGGVNLYGFVYNSPLSWIDIMGRDPYNSGGVSAPPSGSRPIGEPATDLERQKQKEWEDAVKKAWDDAHYEDSRPTQQVDGKIYKRCGNVYSRITNPADNQSSKGCVEKCQSAIGSRHHYVIDDKGAAHGYPHDAINEPTVATNHDSRRVAAAILIPETSSCRDFWECLRKKLKENRGYSTFTNNCQTNLRDMIEECGGKYESHEDERKK